MKWLLAVQKNTFNSFLKIFKQFFNLIHKFQRVQMFV